MTIHTTANDAAGESRPRQLTLPLLDTDPIWDLRWLILLVPLWWLLGIEQFVWPIGLLVITAKVLRLQHGRVKVINPLKWYLLFLAAVLISSFFIVESFRWLTFLRNLSAYVSALLILFVITNRARSWQKLESVLNAILMAAIMVGVIGLLGELNIWRPSLTSPFGRLLPSWVAETSYGKEVAIRQIGQGAWFVGLGQYFRLSGLYLFAAIYASAIAYVVPFFGFQYYRHSGWRRIVVFLAILLLLVNLIYTTGRVATISLMVGALYFVVVQSRRRRLIRIFLAGALVLAIAVLLLSVVFDVSSASGGGFIGSLQEGLESFVYARGPGSFNSRSAVYEVTLSGFLERPFFGWGTERDIGDLEFPAGSHNEYLGILYRYGLLGAMAFAALLVSLWWSTRPRPLTTAPNAPADLLRYGRWFFVTALINNIFIDPVVDTTAFTFLWASFALLVAARTLALQYDSPEHSDC